LRDLFEKRRGKMSVSKKGTKRFLNGYVETEKVRGKGKVGERREKGVASTNGDEGRYAINPL